MSEGAIFDCDETVTHLAYEYHRVKDVKLSSYADWYLQALYIANNLPVQHPKKQTWISRAHQRKLVWERYLDVLASDEHCKRMRAV